MGIAEEEFRKVEERGVTGKPLLWEIAQAEILGDLGRFLEEDFDLRKKIWSLASLGRKRLRDFSPPTQGRSGAGPRRMVERRDGHDPVFAGVIDRIDVSPSGDAALVARLQDGRDETTFSNMDKDPVRRGTRLQLPVYGLAARQLLGEGVDVKAAYWFVSAKGNFKNPPPEACPSRRDARALRGMRFGTITDGIGKGLFPANPGKDGANCRYCDFKNLCPTRREWHWRQKRRDGRLAAYAAMAEGEGSG